MVFSSTTFIFAFLPVTLLGYYLLKDQVGNYWLLLMSLIFFGWSQPSYLWIILFNIILNYTCAMAIDRMSRFRKGILILAVTLNLAVLYYFKYFDFTIETMNKILGSSIALREIILPIGISFFTFQGMSYVIDVYRRDVAVQKNIFKLGLYIVLFPQLIAGPIVRYRDIAQEIDGRKTRLEDLSSGIERFIIGLAKKVIIANTMASMVDSVWNNGALSNSMSVAWFASIAYTLQIYFDFSGYSDMAIGLGRMLGFHFNENFNLPYISKSISEFWRRWHISLSSWFRDYVYIPLGGNRKRVYLNLAIVFLLTGVWHGASWHYIAWGVWNGAFLLMERFLRDKSKDGNAKAEDQVKNVRRPENGNAKAKDLETTDQRIKIGNVMTENPGSPVRNLLMKVYTLMVVNLGWIIFRAPHTKDALKYMAVMFGLVRPYNVGFTLFWYLDRWTLTIMILGIFFASSLPGRVNRKLTEVIPDRTYMIGRYILLLALLYLVIIRVVSGTYNPFIYFQF